MRQDEERTKLQGHLRRLEQALAEGKVCRAAYQRARRQRLIAFQRLLKCLNLEARNDRKCRRAARNLCRWEARTGLEGTGPMVDARGEFHYWNFARNEVQVWGLGRNRMGFRR